MTECLIQDEINQTEQSARGLAESVARLRKALNRCEKCPVVGCASLHRLNKVIQSAIDEVTEQWLQTPS